MNMNLFTNLKNSLKNVVSSTLGYADSSSISEDERPYYKQDDYYTLCLVPEDPSAGKVITFEERKKCSYPSNRGLYVGEILLLDYCNQRKYPKPSSGYPGFWWFEYGIRDIGHMLESLMDRGFITWASFDECIAALNLSELEWILKSNSLPTNGKKSDLIHRICSELNNQWDLIQPRQKKYALTELGKAELTENGYVPYMHKHPHRTNDDTVGKVFNVWSVNRLFKDGHASNWMDVVGKYELDNFGVDTAHSYQIFKTESKKIDFPSLKESVRKYLSEQKQVILDGIAQPGTGFEEEMKGIDYKRIGKDKEALVQFYISIGKKFDAPALYNETAALLRKYEMFDEELLVLNKAIKIVSKNNWHIEEIERQLAKAQERLNKNT